MKQLDKVVSISQYEYETMRPEHKAIVASNGGYMTQDQYDDYRFHCWCDSQPVSEQVK